MVYNFRQVLRNSNISTESGIIISGLVIDNTVGWKLTRRDDFVCVRLSLIERTRSTNVTLSVSFQTKGQTGEKFFLNSLTLFLSHK